MQVQMRAGVFLGILAAVCLSCGGGGSSGTATATSKCSGEPPSGGETALTLPHEGRERTYRLFVPSGYRHDEGTPLLLDFHGTGETALRQSALSRLNQTAEKLNILVVHPEGLPLDGRQVFDAGRRDFSEAPRNDVDFARTIVDDVASRACLDRSRVFSTGMSNGGRMSFRIGCEGADFIAAIAPVSGVLSLAAEDCQPERPVPSIHFHGTADPVAPYDGRGFSVRSAPEMFSLWAEKTRCTGNPEQTLQLDDVTCETYLECAGGTEVTLCTIEGMGHCWPGTSFCPVGPANQTIDANELMLDFMLRFRLD